MPFFPEKPPRDSQREAAALADVYGVPPEFADKRQKKEIMNTQLSQEEIEKMRALVMAHDQKNQGQEFDLSKPIIVPYSHIEFPKVVYNHEQSEPGFWAVRKTAQGDDLFHTPAKLANSIVNNQVELEAALEEGYQEDAPVLDDCNTQDDPHMGFGRPETKRKPGRQKAR